jgi:hypothetical protein
MATSASPGPDPTTEKPPRSRRWIPLSLRTFVAILVVAGAWSGVLVYRQSMAIKQIASLGGGMEGQQRAPAWLERYVPAPLFSKIEVVDLDDKEADDATLWHVSRLTDVELLHLANTRITDAGLPCLQRLPRLRQLDLANTQVTDAGMASLNRITALDGLSLANTQITDAGLADLKALTGLEILRVDGTHVTAAGVAELKKSLPNLWVNGAPPAVRK